jgi:hypothetical protein
MITMKATARGPALKTKPAASASPPRGRGRPRADEPKAVTTIHVARVSLDWIAEHVPRSTSRSAFIDEAIREKIERLIRAARRR